MKNRKYSVALIIFNSIGFRMNEYWGNMVISVLSGRLKKMGIENDVYLALMVFSQGKKNMRTIKNLIKRISSCRYDIILFSSCWLPWIWDEVVCGCPDAVVARMDRKDEMATLTRRYPFMAGANFECFLEKRDEADLGFNEQLFAPNMDYIVLGGGRRARQTVTDVISFGCDYRKNLVDNEYYATLGKKILKAYRGCSYCAAGCGFQEMSADYLTRALFIQVKYFAENMPWLERIQLPYPQVFFKVLPEVTRRLKEAHVKPVHFYIQLRPDVLVERKRDLKKALNEMAEGDYKLYLAVVGFENFSEKELLIMNRGYGPNIILTALSTLKELEKKYGNGLDMSEAVASFILFNPYTELKDLEVNLSGIEANDFGLFKHLNINKMRINHGTALCALADKDGLIDKGKDNRTLTDLPVGGFHEESVYRFLHPVVGSICDAYQKLCGLNLSMSPRAKIYALHRIVNHFKKERIGAANR